MQVRHPIRALVDLCLHPAPVEAQLIVTQGAFANVQFCSAQRERLGKPLLEFTRDDLRTHANTHKGCEAGCSLLCHCGDSAIDNQPLRSISSLFKVFVRSQRPSRAARSMA